MKVRGRSAVVAVSLVLLIGVSPDLLDAQEALQLTTDVLQPRIEQIEQAKDLDEETRTAVLELYRQALAQLAEGEKFAKEAADLEEERLLAPGKLEAVKAALATEAPQPIPQVSEDASLADLEQGLAQAQAQLAALQETATDIEAALAQRTQRRAEVPGRIPVVKQQIDELTARLAARPPQGQAGALSEAQRVLHQAQLEARQQELRKLEAEIPGYDATREALRARRDLLARQLSHAEKLVKAWQDLVSDRRKEEAARAAQEAQDALRAAANAHPVVRKLAEENADLAEQRALLVQKIETVTQRAAEIDAARKDLRDRRASTERKLTAAGLTRAMGVMLRKQRAELPDVRSLRREMRTRLPEISDVGLKLIELDEELAELRDIDTRVEEIVGRAEPPVAPATLEYVRGSVKKQLEDQREYVRALAVDYSTYFDRLTELEPAEQQFIRDIEGFAAEIDERILWFRSTTAFGPSDFPRSGYTLLRLTDPGQWAGVVAALWDDASGHPLISGVAAAALVLLLVFRRRMGRKLEQIGALTRRMEADSFLLTIHAFFLTGLLSLPGPLLLFYVAWRLRASVEASDFAKAVAGGLAATGALLLTAEFFRQLCREQGLADRHFQWRSRVLGLLRRHLFWFMAVALPLAFVVTTLEGQENELWRESLGRLAFIVALIAAGVFTVKILAPSTGVLADTIRLHEGGWLDRLQLIWYPASVGVPLVLAGGAALGYYYTVLQLTIRLVWTIWLVLALLCINGAVARWLFVERRRMGVEKARKRRAEAGAKAAGAEGEVVPPAEEAEPSIFAMSVQTRNVLRSILTLALIVGLWLIWADLFPALKGLNEQEIPWTHTSVAQVGLALLIVFVTVIAARNIPGLLEITVLQRLPLDPGVRYAVSAICRYALSIVGVAFAFGAIGIGWSRVQWLAAAITVGLGFGLQEIFANFVSGLIILFERPMRIGDTVTVGDITGIVTRIRIRATTIRDWDRKELVVPNKEFITGQLINWTLSDTILRVVVPVGIAYGSDTALAERLLYQVAAEHPYVLEDPKSMVIFTQFGASSLDFELRVYIPSMEHYLKVWHDLHLAIDHAFREAGIEIAFPQRDVHIRSVEQAPPTGGQRSDRGEPRATPMD